MSQHHEHDQPFEEITAPVNIDTVKSFRDSLGRTIHGDPENWNVLVYPKANPIPEFSAEGINRWFEYFREAHYFIAVWCNMMFPNLMKWSTEEPLEGVFNLPGKMHDIWWKPVLYPLQIDYFLKRFTPANN